MGCNATIVEQRRNQFVALVARRLLPEREPPRGGEGRHRMQGRHVRGAVMTAAPSMATKSGRSGQVSRTQAVKQAENRAGSSRFIRIVSRRPVGTP